MIDIDAWINEHTVFLASGDCVEVAAIHPDDVRALAAHLRASRGEWKSPGVEAIARERQRQIEMEGWSAKHDDEHQLGELARAAAWYALPSGYRIAFHTVADLWPWASRWRKPSPNNRIRELEKAATPGPWETCELATPNEELKIAARNALPALLDEIERLRNGAKAHERLYFERLDEIEALRKERDALAMELFKLRSQVAAGVYGPSLKYLADKGD